MRILGFVIEYDLILNVCICIPIGGLSTILLFCDIGDFFSH